MIFTFIAGTGFDADAEAFFTAAGITDSTQKNAINDLVVSLKNNSLWTKMTAIYPMVGGSASSHAVNLKSPGTYNLTFYGGWTHDANGITGNGTTGYADTGLNAQSVLSINNVHISIYSRTQTPNTLNQPMRANDGTNDLQVSPNVNFPGFGRVATGGGDFSAGNINQATTDARGNYISSRTSSTLLTFYNGATSLGTNTSSGTWTLPNRTIYLGAANASGSAANYSNINIAFATIGQGLSGTDASNFASAVTTYQTALSRNV